MSRRFVEDKSDRKENLSVGGYRNGEGEIHLMDVVRKAEKAIVEDPGLRGCVEVGRKQLRILSFLPFQATITRTCPHWATPRQTRRH